MLYGWETFVRKQPVLPSATTDSVFLDLPPAYGETFTFLYAQLYRGIFYISCDGGGCFLEEDFLPYHRLTTRKDHFNP